MQVRSWYFTSLFTKEKKMVKTGRVMLVFWGMLVLRGGGVVKYLGNYGG